MANNSNVILETEAKVVVSRESFVNKATGENVEYNSFKLCVAGEEFKFKLDPSDRKLFVYITGIGR